MYAVHHTGSRNLWSVGFDVRRMQQLQSLRGTPIERGGSPQASGRNLRGRLGHHNLLEPVVLWHRPATSQRRVYELTCEVEDECELRRRCRSRSSISRLTRTTAGTSPDRRDRDVPPRALLRGTGTCRRRRREDAQAETRLARPQSCAACLLYLLGQSLAGTLRCFAVRRASRSDSEQGAARSQVIPDPSFCGPLNVDVDER